MHFHTERTINNFWDRVDVRGPDDCWNWTGGLNQDGYGRVQILKGKIKGAHRMSAWLDGRDPTGQCVCHTCDNPTCVNPKHLVVASVAWNNADKKAKGRDHKPKGELNPRAKLTEKDVFEIRRQLGLGIHYTAIALERGLHEETVRHIKVGNTWTHI